MLRELDPDDDYDTGTVLAATPWLYMLLVKAEFRLDTSGEVLLLSDSLTEIVGSLIDGYGQLGESDDDHDEATFLRYLDLAVKAELVHLKMIEALTASGVLDLTTLGESALTALFQEKTKPFQGVARASTGRGLFSRQNADTLVLAWDCAAPLILFVTDYPEPTVRPSGNIIWLDPTDELAYVHSLAGLGIADLTIDACAEDICEVCGW